MSERLAEMVRGLSCPVAGTTRYCFDYQQAWNAATAATADLIANSPELAEMERDAGAWRSLMTCYFDDSRRDKKPTTALSPATNVGSKVSSEQFTEHCERASEIVATWPEWKRNVLGTESKGT